MISDILFAIGVWLVASSIFIFALDRLRERAARRRRREAAFRAEIAATNGHAHLGQTRIAIYDQEQTEERA